MKRLIYILAVAALLLPGCKTEKWADWRLENELWLENIATKSGVITTPTGLRYEVLAQPSTTGQHPDDLKTVIVSYKGSLITGNTFDNQLDSKTALSVSSVISGFAEGLKKMTPGAHYMLYIPYNLTYGTDGTGTEGGMGYIPPYSTLIFDITLHNVY